MKHGIKDFKISKLRAILALFILILSSICFYGFFYMFRECIRAMSVSEEYDIWLLSDVETRFYNTFYAGVAIVMGVSSAIKFIIDKPTRLNRGKTLRSSILNDQNFLNWSFLHWFLELSLCFGLFFTIGFGYFEYSLYPQFSYIFVLIVIVLFLNIWMSISRYVKLNNLKMLLFAGLLFAIGSFLLGSINFIDYDSTNKEILKKNVFYSYDLSKPVSSYWNETDKNWYSDNLYIAFDKDTNSVQPIYIFDNKKVQHSEIDSLMYKWRIGYRISKRPRLLLNLHVDQHTEMQYLNDLKYKLAKVGAFRIAYSVVPPDMTGDPRKYRNYNILSRIYDYDLFSIAQPTPKFDSISIKMSNDQFYIDQILVDRTKLSESIEALIYSIPNYLFLIDYDEKTSYKDFIELYSTIGFNITQCREKASRIEYGKEYDNISDDEKKFIRAKCPYAMEDMAFKRSFNL